MDILIQHVHRTHSHRQLIAWIWSIFASSLLLLLFFHFMWIKWNLPKITTETKKQDSTEFGRTEFARTHHMQYQTRVHKICWSKNSGFFFAAIVYSCCNIAQHREKCSYSALLPNETREWKNMKNVFKLTITSICC